jgi:hypothetical protein
VIATVLEALRAARCVRRCDDQIAPRGSSLDGASDTVLGCLMTIAGNS